MLKSLWSLLVVLLAFYAGPARADQNDERLDELFGQLQVIETPHEARLIESVIWQVWLESGSPTVDLLMGEAMAAMSEDRPVEALGLLNSIVEQKPDFAEGWNKRATLYYVLGRYEESIADVERTLALEPRHFGALGGLGLIFDQLDDDAGALDAYERALKVNPHLPHARARIDSLRQKVRGQKT